MSILHQNLLQQLHTHRPTLMKYLEQCYHSLVLNSVIYRYHIYHNKYFWLCGTLNLRVIFTNTSRLLWSLVIGKCWSTCLCCFQWSIYKLSSVDQLPNFHNLPTFTMKIFILKQFQWKMNMWNKKVTTAAAVKCFPALKKMNPARQQIYCDFEDNNMIAKTF